MKWKFYKATTGNNRNLYLSGTWWLFYCPGEEVNIFSISSRFSETGIFWFFSHCFAIIKGALYLFAEKAMAPHSSPLAWKIPWAEEPGKLQSMGLGRVKHNWATSLSLFIFTHWRRPWQPTPVFLPGESQGQGCRLWGRTESDTTEAT